MATGWWSGFKSGCGLIDLGFGVWGWVWICSDYFLVLWLAAALAFSSEGASVACEKAKQTAKYMETSVCVFSFCSKQIVWSDTTLMVQGNILYPYQKKENYKFTGERAWMYNFYADIAWRIMRHGLVHHAVLGFVGPSIYSSIHLSSLLLFLFFLFFCGKIYINLGFLGSSTGKKSACNAGDLNSIDSWVGKFLWRRDRLPTPVFLGFPGGSDGKESTCNVGDLGSIPGLSRSPGGGHGNPLQYSCLENHHG